LSNKDVQQAETDADSNRDDESIFRDLFMPKLNENLALMMDNNTCIYTTSGFNFGEIQFQNYFSPFSTTLQEVNIFKISLDDVPNFIKIQDLHFLFKFIPKPKCENYITPSSVAFVDILRTPNERTNLINLNKNNLEIEKLHELQD